MAAAQAITKWDRWLSRRFGLPPAKLRRLAHFLFLAVSLVTVNVLAITLAESLFLSYAGSEHIPIFYVLLAVVSIPLAGWFSRLVDRIPRLRLFRYLLFVAVLVIIGLRALITLQTTPVYYAIFIGFTVIELLIDIQFWVLVSDYFTSLELKRYAPFLVMAMAVGGLLGGGLAGFLSDLLATEDLLLLLPLLFGIATAQLFFLERSQTELELAEEEEKEESLVESLKFFPRIVGRYPIVFLIATTGLMAVIVQYVIEYQVFTIYSDAYPDADNLTSFLGVLHAGMSVLEFSITYFITRPLIQKLGVSRMNLIYPVAQLGSLIGLAFSFRLPMAIASNISYDTLAQSVAQPVETLNYNAVPSRFRGRVRVISDGFFYPCGLALAGGILLISQEFLSTLQISLIGIVMSFGLLAISFMVGRGYPQSLLQGLRSRSVNLDEVGEGLSVLPPQYAEQVRELLANKDHAAQILGLELAARMDPAQFIGEARALFSSADPNTLRSLVRFYCAFRPKDISSHIMALLNSKNATARATALETLIIRAVPLSDQQLRKLLEDSDSRVRALACVAVHRAESVDRPLVEKAKQILEADLSLENRRSVVQAIRGAGDPRLLPLLRKMLTTPDAEVRREALEALAGMTSPGDEDSAQLAAEETSHTDPAVRSAAYKVIGIARPPDRISQVASGLADQSQLVRESAAASLAGFGQSSLTLAETYMHSVRSEVVDAAISAIGKVGTREAEETLLAFMRSGYRQVSDNLRWLGEMPPHEAYWHTLKMALEDNNQRMVNRVLHVLASLGNARTLNSVRRILYSQDERMRADAVETLVSFGRRKFIEPILPLLEHHARGGPWMHGGGHGPERDGSYILQEALQSTDRWIRIGALAVLAKSRLPLPQAALTGDPDPLVSAALLHTVVAKSYLDTAGSRAAGVPQPSRPISEEDFAFMNRVLFLKNISLFQYLTLDQLLIIDEILEQKEYLAGETIFAQESVGSSFYVIYRGKVMIRRKFEEEEQELAELTAGEFFGEMALFDDSPRSATAMAVTDCTLLSVDRSHFHSLIVQRPEIAMELCRVMSLRLRKANERLGWWRWRVSWRGAPGTKGS